MEDPQTIESRITRLKAVYFHNDELDANEREKLEAFNRNFATLYQKSQLASSPIVKEFLNMLQGKVNDMAYLRLKGRSLTKEEIDKSWWLQDVWQKEVLFWTQFDKSLETSLKAIESKEQLLKEELSAK